MGELARWGLPSANQGCEVSTLLLRQDNAILFHEGLLVWLEQFFFFQGYLFLFFRSNEA
jgi:hypothetical protein